MRQELDDLLCQRYPDIFRDRYGDPATSCMPRGFECGDGWFDLIDRLCARLTEKIASGEIPPVVATQVKNKFGSLRFYTHGGNDVSREMIHAAEAESAQICDMRPEVNAARQHLELDPVGRCSGGLDVDTDLYSMGRMLSASARHDRLRFG